MLRGHVDCLTVGAVLVIAAHAGAQQLRDCPPARETRDSVALLVTVAARPLDPTQGVSTDEALSVAAAVAQRLALPPILSMVVYIGHGGSSGSTGRAPGAHLDLDATYGVTLAPDGHLRQLRVITSSLDAQLDSAALAAVRTTAEERAFPHFSAVRTDTVAFGISVSASDSARARGIPVLRVHIPLRQLDRRLQQLSDIAPPYPQSLRAQRVEGRVDVSFVVDDTGAVIPSTISVRSASDIAFARAVLTTVPRLRFEPAIVDGCRVPFRAAIPFLFSLAP